MDNPNVIRQSTSSAEIVDAIFTMHMPHVSRVLDLTYGNGTFWEWEHPFSIDFDRECDFRKTAYASNAYECVVFDPPFTANGPSEGGHNIRYGADRSLSNSPQNIHEVRSLLASGLIEAMRISSKFVLVKTMDVIESGKLNSSTEIVFTLFHLFGYRIRDYVLYDAPRRPQPDIERGATVRHFRNRPSVFILGEKIKHR